MTSTGVKSLGIVLPALSRAPSGGYKVLYAYANGLRRLGHHVVVYHGVKLSGWPASSDRSRREVVTDYLRHSRVGKARPAWYPLDRGVPVVNSTRLRPSDLGPHDVLVASAAETAPLVATAAEQTGARGVYFIQHFEEWVGEQAVTATWRLPLAHVVIAPWLAELSRQHGGNPLLVPNAIDSAEFPLGPPSADREFDVAAMVSDKPFKRTDLVVSVLNEVASARSRRAVTFGTIPRPDGLHPSIVHHQSPKPDVLRGIYQQSRVFLCCSDAEGWHLPPAEAMVSGCAVVSTAIPGVQAYASGLASFAPVGDRDGLRDAVVALIGNPSECQQLASRGARELRSYSPGHAVRAFERAVLEGLR